MPDRSGWIVGLGVFALAMINCQLDPVKLPVKDSDDDADEALVPCDDASMCAGLDEEKMCHPRLGFCVECVSTADCGSGQRCDPLEFECDRN